MVSATVEPTIDLARRAEIYQTFCDALPLSATHRRELQTRRGFTDATIDALGFRSIGDRKSIEAALRATGATDEELVASHLLSQGREAIYPNSQLTKKRGILIPYLTKDGKISKLRVHKNNFYKDPIKPYCAFIAFAHEPDPLIITEGEFKAAALHQLGYAALAVPGISSFAGDHFDELAEAIERIRPKRVIVCFDREIKNDPALEGFKADYRKRWDTEVYTWYMAHKIGLNAYVAQLPLEWMVDGKVDFDQALAAGRGRADFDALFKKAKTPVQFLDSLEGEASTVVLREARKRLRGERPSGLREQHNPALGYAYYWHEHDERKNETKVTRVSDFVFKLNSVVHTDENGKERIVQLVDTYGEPGPPTPLLARDLSSIQAFKQWVLANGECTWFGGSKALDSLCEHLNMQGDGSIIRRTAITGEVEDNLWLFQNGVIADGHYIEPSSNDGVAWFGRRGFELEVESAQPRLLRENPEAARMLGPQHAELLELLRKNQRGRLSGWLGLGWCLATLFRRVLFNRFKFFPLLYCMGQKGSGKTTFARWMMNGVFGINTLGKPMLSTEKSQYRLLAKRSSLPAWFDEFRETRDLQRHITAFCSIYNGQGYGRARRTGGLETDEVPVRGSLMLSGVVPPKDDQLQSRCIYLTFAEALRDNKGATFDELNLRIEEFNDFLISALLRYDELADQVVEGTKAAADAFKGETGDARMATNYAMAVSAFHAVCGDIVDSSELLDFAREAMAGTGARLAAEHPLADFWEAVSAMASKGYVDKHHIGCDDETVYVWLPGLFHAFERDYRGRRGMDVPFRARDIRDWLGQQEYWMDPPLAEGGKPRTNRRMGGAVKRVIYLDRGKVPEPLAEAVDAIYDPRPQEPPEASWYV
jgi:DNA primase